MDKLGEGTHVLHRHTMTSIISFKSQVLLIISYKYYLYFILAYLPHIFIENTSYAFLYTYIIDILISLFRMKEAATFFNLPKIIWEIPNDKNSCCFLAFFNQSIRLVYSTNLFCVSIIFHAVSLV